MSLIYNQIIINKESLPIDNMYICENKEYYINRYNKPHHIHVYLMNLKIVVQDCGHTVPTIITLTEMSNNLIQGAHKGLAH